jgi:hypothetical protein
MRITISLFVLLTVLIVLMLRFRHKGDGLTVFEFLLCGAWGFLLAGSTAAPAVHRFLDGLASMVSR